MGVTLGPILNMYLSLPNGDQLVMTALGATGVIFLSLSGYALTSRKDFSFMGAFLMVGILVAFLAGLASVFFTMPGLVTGCLGHVRVAHVRLDPLPDQRTDSWW